MSSEIVRFKQGETRNLLNKGDMSKIASSEQIKSIDMAREILGERFFGQKEIESALNIKIMPYNFPHMPFTEIELERAKEDGMHLILRAPQTMFRAPLSMQFLIDHLGPTIHRDDLNSSRIVREDFFTKETPRPGWFLALNKPDPDTMNGYYLQQIHTLANNVNDFFDDDIPHKEFEIANSEFYLAEHSIYMRLISGNNNHVKNATEELAKQKLTQLLMPTAVEVLYDFLVTFNTTKSDQLLSNNFVSTISLNAYDEIVNIGQYTHEGLRIFNSYATIKYKNLCALQSFKLRDNNQL